MKNKAPLNERLLLTIKEAAEYSGIGEKKVRELAEIHSPFTLWVGSKCMIKRKAFADFLLEQYSI